MEDTTAAQFPDPTGGTDGAGGSAVIGPSSTRGPVPTPGFSNLDAPAPVDAAPPESARLAAFVAILVGGLLGGLIGYGVGDILYPESIWAAVGALAGASTGAVGLGVLSNLTLRAMNEWKTAAHPESDTPAGSPDTAADPAAGAS